VRLLFTTHPAYGHFHPLLPLASAARDAGHDVRVATSARFAPVVEAAGFPAIRVGLDWLEADKSTIPDELRPAPDSTLEQYFAQQFVTAPAEPFARGVVGHAATWRPDLVVRERTEFGGSIAAAALGIPVAAVQVASPSLMTPAVFAAIDGPYNQARAGLGLGPDESLAALRSQVVLSFAPPSLHDPRAPLPSGFVSFRPVALDRSTGDRLPAWADVLGRTRPLVYATLGTVFNNPDYELPFFPSVLAGLGDEPLDLVVTVGPNVDPERLGPQAANVRVVSYIPQSLLFPRCAVIVCHGGFGTVLAAIEHGLPLLVVPFGADQPINARSVERLGLGLVIEEDDVTPVRVRDAVRRLIAEPRWRTNVEAIRDEAAGLPGLDAAVALLERIGRG
jgi:UDP:flavonoid glycosyltransferase YjiC (YdhE family)